MKIKTEFIKLCNQNHEKLVAQRRAAEYLAHNKEKRRQKTINVLLAVFTVFICTLAFCIIHTDKANANVAEETKQKYIVRYGTTFDYGSTIITHDGNIWTLIDAPEYTDGTEVRVLFDSMETPSPLDDIIIDITER